jgi:hypothetical protein
MHQLEDEQIETLHVYVMREPAPTASPLPMVLPAVALSLAVALLVLCLSLPSQQPVTRAVIRVPAILLPIKTFTSSAAIIPTGLKTYPATTAHGILTIANGSIIAQIIPAGFVVQGVVTDRAVYVPAGSADGYGRATVSAHAGIPGKYGNIPILAINAVIGSSLYIRNLSAFSGGRDAYSVKYVTEHDRQTAIEQAHNQLRDMVAGLHYPCVERLFPDTRKISVTWRCQMITYTVPSYMRVLRVRLSGKNLLVDVVFTPPPVRIWER